MLAVDHLKNVNDEHGHPAGDAVLRAIAGLLQDNLRDADLCARFGGEEFVVVLPSTPVEGALDTAERIRAAVQKHVMVAGGAILAVTLSAGVSTYRTGEQQGADWLLKEADMALYEAKRSGRNRVCGFAAAEPESPWSLSA